ncbi:hypothetical protein HID58_077753 [Brassica napus]|uniref:Uncharacterized protein n=1 Tax=Brassica napus TaxID=3708 RepID=A0ABQ7YTH7_BRANA|nr:hypothetical protein HID58_077753 [Brassica napus]
MLKTKRMILDVISLMTYLMYNCVVYSSSLASQGLHPGHIMLFSVPRFNNTTSTSLISWDVLGEVKLHDSELNAKFQKMYHEKEQS